MDWLTSLNSRLSRWAMYLAVAGLFGIVIVVVGSVFMRYIMNDAPSWTEQVALIMVICVAMFGASACTLAVSASCAARTACIFAASALRWERVIVSGFSADQGTVCPVFQEPKAPNGLISG